MTVLFSELIVDWLKHAFITKFNHIRPSVYERYTDVLCRDLASGSAVGRRGARKVGYLDWEETTLTVTSSIHMWTNPLLLHVALGLRRSLWLFYLLLLVHNV